MAPSKRNIHVFILKDYFDKFIKENTVKYFAFAERHILDTCYADETSLHFEIVNGKIEKEIKNNGDYVIQNNVKNQRCADCFIKNIVKY